MCLAFRIFFYKHQIKNVIKIFKCELFNSLLKFGEATNKVGILYSGSPRRFC